jgi:ankyrin repeat protein
MACLLLPMSEKLRNHFCENDLVNLCKNGKLKAVKSLLSKITDIEITTLKSALIEACSNGHLKVVKIIVLKNFVDIDKYNLLDILCEGFDKACDNNHLKVSKWLCSILSKLMIFMRSDVFVRACEKGNLKIAKWLYSLPGFVSNSALFTGLTKACEKGNLKVVKWLFTISDPHDNVTSFF